MPREPESAEAIALDLCARATIRQMAEDAATVATVYGEPNLDFYSREEVLGLLVEARRLLKLLLAE
jgi:hypothetical protein